MMKLDLNGEWILHSQKYVNLWATVPGSVLSALLSHGLIGDPFYRENEDKVRQYLYEDYSFTRKFILSEEQLSKTNYLFLDGIDTVAKIYINNCFIADVFDMHTRKRLLLDNSILDKENEIRIEFTSPYRYIEEYDDQGLFCTFAETEAKAPCLRKANYMFGWDWGPDLADMGIYRDIYILSTELGYLEDFRHECTFLPDGSVRVDVTVNVNVLQKGQISASLSLAEDGISLQEKKTLGKINVFSFVLTEPRLWYPVGFGKPTLYDLDFVLCAENGETQKYNYRIGIRDVKIDCRPDEYGTNFCVYVNGIKVFLKGSNYIPEDNILARADKAHTLRLLKLVKDFNHNVIRVWGGGYYPDEYFYDFCDENGILVWQDLMFACASYNIRDEHFKSLIVEETEDAVKRFRHHASVFLIAGDNECEDGVNGHEKELMENYRVMSLEVLVPLMKNLTSTYFLRTSPRSAEMFNHQNDLDHFDTHYWGIWCEDRELEEYKKIYPRMLSEVGHQSFPLMETVRSFAREEDLDLQSLVMLHHQKREGCNTRILNYIKMLYGEPNNFEDVVYLSHLVQGEAIKMCVEHLRRSKFRCNGALYWQLNDCWPGQSWSSIDYCLGIKALHYCSKRFYAPSLISVEEQEDILKVNVSNDTAEDRCYGIRYRYMSFDGTILDEKHVNASVEKTSCKDVLQLPSPFTEEISDKLVHVQLLDDRNSLLSENFYQRAKNQDAVYATPHICVKAIDEHTLELISDTYTKNVCIEIGDPYAVLSDNYFNLLKNEPKVISSDEAINYDSLHINSLNQMLNKLKGC